MWFCLPLRLPFFLISVDSQYGHCIVENPNSSLYYATPKFKNIHKLNFSELQNTKIGIYSLQSSIRVQPVGWVERRETQHNPLLRNQNSDVGLKVHFYS